MSGLDRRRAILVFLAFAFAYFFSAVLRAITATLSPTLTREFALSAQELGLLAGGFFLGFAATQLPLGQWLDRHGPRKVMLGFMGIAVAGCLAFSFAGGFSGLLLARVLCGVGVSACLMAPLTGFRYWLSPPAQLRANSWMLMTGSLGMLASTLPIQWLLPVTGWRPVFWILAAGTGLATAAIAWLLPGWSSSPDPATAPAPAATDRSYARVWADPYFRRMAPLGFVNYGGMIAIQSLWAGPWMVRLGGLDAGQAAQGLFVINFSMLLTFWSWGWLNPWLAGRGISVERLIAWGTPLSLLVLATNVAAGPSAGAASWAAYCVSSTFLALAQPAVGMAFPRELAGRALSAYNLVVFGGVFAVQWGIGLVIDGLLALGWAEASAFRAALATFLAASVACYAVFMRAKG